MMVKSWVMPLIYLDYELRRDFIVRNYCINKDRPQLACNGKCYLSRKIAAAREQDERRAEQIFIFQLLDMIKDCFDSRPALTRPLQVITRQPSCEYTGIFALHPIVTDIFHPPLGRV